MQLFVPVSEDLVYLDDEDLLDEYVMNESGKIYSGNYKQIGYKTWNFGQVSGGHLIHLTPLSTTIVVFIPFF